MTASRRPPLSRAGNVPPQPSRTTGLFRLRPPLSLERKLPLLMTGVLVIALVIPLALTYGTLADAARDAAAVRLSRAARQLASSVETGIGQRATLQRRVAADSAVRRALRSVPNGERDSTRIMAAARATLTRLATPADSGMPRIPPDAATDGRVAWASLTPDRTPAVRSGTTT